MWTDDDLHWSWCTRGRCPNAFDQDPVKVDEYNEAIREAAIRRKQHIEELGEG